jgi:hypothetical protein
MNESEQSLRASPEDQDTTTLDAIIEQTESQAAGLARVDIETRIDVAHRYPRKIEHFIAAGKAAATLTHEIAASCRYSLPRGNKKITGPSVRLSEILANLFGNFESGTRIVDAYAGEGRMVIVEGFAWDLQSNTKRTVQVSRRTTTSQGKPYGDDMRTLTLMAASSIAVRNARFDVIPRAYVDEILGYAVQVAVGNREPLEKRRAVILAGFIAGAKKAGFTIEESQVPRLLGKLEIVSLDWDDLADLLGYGTAIKEGATTWKEVLEPLYQDNPIKPPKPIGEKDVAAHDDHRSAENAEPVAPSKPEPEEVGPEDAVINKALAAYVTRAAALPDPMSTAELRGFLRQFLKEDNEGVIIFGANDAEDAFKAMSAVRSATKAAKK